MKKIYYCAIVLLCLLSNSNSMFAQTAPNFTLKDLDGKTHNLYEYLDQGKTVFLDISATWCQPCWDFHKRGDLKDVYNQLGPDGTDEVVVLFLEGDDQTNKACLEGNTSSCTGNGTKGDWVTGVPYPIIDDAGSVKSEYESALGFHGYPQYYVICPDKDAKQMVWNDMASFDLDMFKKYQQQNCKALSDAEISVDKNLLTNVYPNPSSGDFIVSISSKYSIQAEMKIIGVTGQAVWSSNFKLTKGINEIPVEASSLEFGSYVLQIKSADQVISKNITIVG